MTSLAFGILGLALAHAAAAPATINPGAAAPDRQLNYRCLLAPELPLCEGVYRKAMHDSSPASTTLREAYQHYARYLTGSNALTGSDRQYLRANGIDLPNDLTPLETSGLHNAINDASLKSTADRKSNVTNYLLRAEEANIYCGLQTCNNPRQS